MQEGCSLFFRQRGGEAAPIVGVRAGLQAEKKGAGRQPRRVMV